MNHDKIRIRGARVHNLKNISIEIPRDKLVVITGPSGCGKSSLAFDTIYAEGQRRYVESLSAYARQFLEQVSKPDCDEISGLSPTISIEQGSTSHNPRSTVGTVTEVYDYLRLLFARISKAFCHQCHKPIQSQSPQQIIDQVMSTSQLSKITIMAPIAKERKGEYQKELAQLRLKGFVRARIDGRIVDLGEDISLEKNIKHTIDVVIDRIIMKGDAQSLAARISDSVELALKLGLGLMEVEVEHQDKKSSQIFSEKFSCSDCGISYPSPEPRSFSFNSPIGACDACEGLGVDPKTIIEIDEDADTENEVLGLGHLLMDDVPCSKCKGSRLRPESLAFQINKKNIHDFSVLSLFDLRHFLSQISLSTRERLIVDRVIKEILERLDFLCDVGVEYLSLSRGAQTLSGGEAQRIRLATQIGSSLVGVIYVLDEPSIGLHQRDNIRLLRTLAKLRDLGNTVLVVEHDRDTMEHADWIVDIGPGAGIHGGEIIANGTYEEILKVKKSSTADYLKGIKKIPIPSVRRPTHHLPAIKISGAKQNNLKNVSIEFPIGVFTCVTGVSGSGKSTLVMDTLLKGLASKLGLVSGIREHGETISGHEKIDRIIDIDQSPIGRTPRSNPATYTGVLTFIRDLFSQLQDSQVRGFSPGRFSFNVKGGRCEACEGGGMTRIEMHFLPDVFVQCEVCKGTRYNRDTLDIRFRDKNIAEILALSVEEALGFFDTVYFVKHKLQTLYDVGLGYITLGQSATSLSGGEAQRMKLARELSKKGTGSTLYILDEPSTGLHFEDIHRLVEILHRLTAQGNTVVVIEHNLDIIKSADYLIDMGPEGGEAGGRVLSKGTPEMVARDPKSETGKFLKPYLSL